MWILLTVTMLTIALIVHFILTRTKQNTSPVFCFLLAGFPIGIVLVGLALWFFGATEQTLAAIFVYAVSCDFILHFFSLATNGVSVSMLNQLSKGPADFHTLNSIYSTKAMVARRIHQLQLDGFLVKHHGDLELTAKGKVMVETFLKCRDFFGHEPLLENIKINTALYSD